MMSDLLQRNDLLATVELLSSEWNHLGVIQCLGDFSHDLLAAEPALGYRLALAYFYSDRLDASKSLLDRVTSQCEILGPAKVYRRCLNLQGVISIATGKLMDAERLLSEALSRATAEDDQVQVANVTTNLGVVADIRCDWYTAVTLHQLALVAFQRIGDRGSTGLCFHNLGMAFRQLEQYSDSATCFDHAIQRLSGGQTDSLLVAAEIERGLLSWSRGDEALSEVKAQWALQKAQKIGSHRLTGEALRVLGIISLGLGYIDRAHSYLHRSINIAKEENIPMLQAELYELLAIMMEYRGHYDKVETYVEKAKVLYEGMGAEARARHAASRTSNVVIRLRER